MGIWLFAETKLVLEISKKFNKSKNLTIIIIIPQKLFQKVSSSNKQCSLFFPVILNSQHIQFWLLFIFYTISFNTYFFYWYLCR